MVYTVKDQLAIIDDPLLDALADRWPFVERDWSGQTFEAWLLGKLRDYNRFGYARHPDIEPSSLWAYVRDLPQGDYEDYVRAKARELREAGGSFIKRVPDLRPLVRLMLTCGRERS